MALRTWRLVAILALVCAFAALPGRAQDDGEDEDDPHTANLGLTIDKAGMARVSFSMPAAPSQAAQLPALLGSALHCAPGRVGPPPAWRTPKVSSWSQAQREAYEKSAAEARARQLVGSCGPVAARQGMVYSARIDLLPLLKAMQTDGVQTLVVEVTAPDAGSVTYSPEGKVPVANQDSVAQGQYAIYSFAATSARAQVAVEYGYRRSDLQRMLLLSLAYVLVPFAILLWIRRATLRSSGDPTDAWFTYFRAMNWCVNGAVLLWCLTRLSPLHSVLQFFSFLGLTGIYGTLAMMAAILAPPALLYAGASWASYPVFARFRGATVSRREYVLGQLLQLGTVFLPLNLFIGGAMLAVSNGRAGAILMVLAVVVYMACADLRMRITRSAPIPVTSGELRDRIFALADKVGVKVKQVFIMPAARTQVANAFAARNGMVMFTDYLLQRLDKREVDAIAAHELTHLRHKHPAKLQMVMLAIILLPGGFASVLIIAAAWIMRLARLASASESIRAQMAVTSFLYRFDQSGWRDVVWFTLGFGFFYLLARRFEKTADLGAVRATGDGAALITGLVKVSSLNLMPLRWGRVTGATLTHPSTQRRLEYIAAACNIPAAQVKELVMSATSPAASAPVAYDGVDSRAVEAGSARALQTARTTRKKLWILIAMHVLPATLVAWLVQTFLIVGTPGAVLKLLGMVATLVLYAFAMHWLGIRGRAKVRRIVLARIEKSGIKLDAARATLVGFSPGPNPRHYINSYDWDRGFLLLARGRLHFVGEQTRFALSSSQVISVTLGAGAPSWFNFPRIYVDWRDEGGVQRTFSFSAAEPCSLFEIRQRIATLQQRLSAWLQGVSDQVRPPEELAALAEPASGEITCHSPRELTSFGKFLTTYLILVIPSAAVLCMLLRLNAFSYVAGTGLLVRFYEAIPYWRYRDRVPQAAAAGKPAERMAAAG